MSDEKSGRQSASYAMASMNLQPVAETASTGTFTTLPRHHELVTQSRTIVHTIDDLDLEEFLQIAGDFGYSRFAYAVTPNVDHLIRCHEEPQFRALYRSAEYVLMDSRFISRVLRVLTGRGLRVCTGSDLTAQLLNRVVLKDDPIVIIGGSEEQIAKL